MNLRDTGSHDGDWFQLAQNLIQWQLVTCCEQDDFLSQSMQLDFFHYLYDYEIFERPFVYRVPKTGVIHSAFRNVTNK
jgi:hypothetical protein